MYENGEGVPQDYAEAVELYWLAAIQGENSGAYGLAQLYRNGLGVRQDYAEAAKWYRVAAERSNPEAQTALGLLYGEGLGLPQDYVQAHTWFNIAAAQGQKEAIQGRDLVAQQMTPADISTAQQMAREWLEHIRFRRNILH